MKKVYITAAVLCALIAAFCVYKSLPTKPTELPEPIEDTARIVEERAEPILETEKMVSDHEMSEESAQTTGEALTEQGEAPAKKTAAESADADGSYDNPIDYESLRKVNDDIYAWLYIPGTEINYPILQSDASNDDYYLDHNVYGNKDANGSIFSESLYNDTDFGDFATILYGHRMRSGKMFGKLQKLYSGESSIKQHREIIVYTQEEELHYKVFAAMSFSSYHILDYYNGFGTQEDIDKFVEDLNNHHSMSSYFEEDTGLSLDDRILILSTCLSNNREQRFLVLAKLV